MYDVNNLYSGGYCGGVPPLPIPNREVKPACADGTAMQCGRVGGRHFFDDEALLSAMTGGLLLFCITGITQVPQVGNIEIIAQKLANRPWILYICKRITAVIHKFTHSRGVRCTILTRAEQDVVRCQCVKTPKTFSIISSVSYKIRRKTLILHVEIII